ncbi:aggregation-promoting factor C-terminal-like domain-containing protein [Agromyces bracchium]|uniref:aggregation-promoting factor C-terminal-like domain-containing protein n=1 Tax=Agromyces bracchium TaxID=88376 RepID=UPI0035EEAC8A
MGRHSDEYDDVPMDAVRERWARADAAAGVRPRRVPQAARPVRPATDLDARPAVRPDARSAARPEARASGRPAQRGSVAGPVKQAATVVFAFAASVSFLLVNVVDPYSGATATSTYVPVDRFGGETAQEVELADGYSSLAVASEGYVVEAKPDEPEPAAAAGWAPPAVVPDPGSAQAYGAQAVAARGWPTTEFDCLVALWSKESGWRVNAYNASSGAYGIPQALPGSKMATAGADWETNAATQIEWGLGYIQGRYGTPCGAWAHSQSVGWY